MPLRLPLPSLSPLLLVACSLAPSHDGPRLKIPSYPADDPRPKSGGFVRDVRLAEVQRDGTTFVLMAWQVGDVLTLGAMTQGPFEGSVEWQLDGATLRFPVAAEPRSGDVAIATQNAPPGTGELVGDKAGFRDYSWTNVDLDAARWFRNQSGPLSLTFVDGDGEAAARLPATGQFAAGLIAR